MHRTTQPLPTKLFTAVLATIIACGGDTTRPTTPPPPPAAVSSVALTPAALTLVPQQAEPLAVTLRDAQGNPPTGRTMTWSTDAPTAASVSADGRVSALAVGTARISAASEGGPLNQYTWRFDRVLR